MHANSLIVWNMFSLVLCSNVFLLNSRSMCLRCDWHSHKCVTKCGLVCLKKKLVVTYIMTFWHCAVCLSRRTMSELSSRQPCPPQRCRRAINPRLSASRRLWQWCRRLSARVQHCSLQTPVWTASPGPSLSWALYCHLLELKEPKAWRWKRRVGLFKISVVLLVANIWWLLKVFFNLMLFSGLAVELSFGQFLHNLGLEHLLEIFDREQVLSSVSVLITVEASLFCVRAQAETRVCWVRDKVKTMNVGPYEWNQFLFFPNSIFLVKFFIKSNLSKSMSNIHNLTSVY